jgi:hypothetical protein
MVNFIMKGVEGWSVNCKQVISRWPGVWLLLGVWSTVAGMFHLVERSGFQGMREICIASEKQVIQIDGCAQLWGICPYTVRGIERGSPRTG